MYFNKYSKIMQEILELQILVCIMWEVSCAMQKIRLDDPGGSFCLEKYSWINSEAKQISVLIMVDEDWSYCDIFS